jgi:SIR2-like protein
VTGPIHVVPTPSEDDWATIVQKLHMRRCVPFLGAGASLGSDGEVGLPTAGQLATILADKCEFPGKDRSDFFRVTQYFRMVRDEDILRAEVAKALRVKGAGPTGVHRQLAGLPFAYVLTTNFDGLMERAFEVEEGKSPKVFSYLRRGNVSDLPNATEQEPIVYKLHGSIEKPESMVLTEDDVVDFLACVIGNDPGIPPAIKQLFQSYSILFIGYGLKDINVRVLLRALRGRRDVAPDYSASFAIQRGPADEGLAQEWQQTVMYFRAREALRCFDVDARVFVAELKDRYDKHVKEMA